MTVFSEKRPHCPEASNNYSLGLGWNVLDEKLYEYVMMHELLQEFNTSNINWLFKHYDTFNDDDRYFTATFVHMQG